MFAMYTEESDREVHRRFDEAIEAWWAAPENFDDVEAFISSFQEAFYHDFPGSGVTDTAVRECLWGYYERQAKKRVGNLLKGCDTFDWFD